MNTIKTFLCCLFLAATFLPLSFVKAQDAPANSIMPGCAYTEKGCRDLNQVVELGINIGKFIFSITGSVAFIMFIYGGITMIMSFGNPEKFKQGQAILIAAVTGVIISLSAYIAVDFLLDALNVSQDFRSV